jgi:hypothetical protein
MAPIARLEPGHIASSGVFIASTISPILDSSQCEFSALGSGRGCRFLRPCPAFPFLYSITSYARAVREFFDWCEDHRLGLDDIEPIAIAAYIEQLGAEAAKPTVKQNLAAIRQMFDYLVTGGILPSNPAGSVRGPKYVVNRGKTPSPFSWSSTFGRSISNTRVETLRTARRRPQFQPGAPVMVVNN